MSVGSSNGAQSGARVIQGPWAQVSTGPTLSARTLDVFNDVLPSAWEGYAPRDGQLRLTRAIAETVERGGVLLADGPCGTGKSLAYLVPAILHADREGRSVLVVTASIALQEQLVTKDLPRLAKALAPALSTPLTFALLKGRSNYICKHTLNDPSLKAPDYFSPDERAELDALDAWARTTKTGDRGDLPLIVRDGVWQLRTVGTDECLRDGCEHYGTCFARAAREEARNARIVVVNYALLFAHVSVRREMHQDVVVPTTASKGLGLAWDTVIYDEAHEAADKARDALGCDISEGSFKGVTRWLTRHASEAIEELNIESIKPAQCFDTANDIEMEAASLWATMSALVPEPQQGPRGRKDEKAAPFRIRDGVPAGALRDAMDRAAKYAATIEVAADRAAKLCEDDEDDTPLRKIQRRAENAKRRAVRIASWLDAAECPQEFPTVVMWIERCENTRRRTSFATLCGAFVDVSPIFQDELWNRTRATVLTSATLTTGHGESGWEWIRARLGLNKETSRSVAVPSPFDFARQAVFCVPMAPPLPDPSKVREQFDAAVCQIMLRVARAAEGRTLGLFTSMRMARRAAEFLRAANLTWPVLCQGEETRQVLIDRVRREPAILCGTRSLWTGVDIQGESIVAVVIDKIPFPAPGDPVLDALGEIAAARTGDKMAGWREHSLPIASLEMRQGAGRLIRSASDWGAVVVCDPRMVTKGYGKAITQLIGMPTQVRSMGDVEQWFRDRKSSSDNSARGDQ